MERYANDYYPSASDEPVEMQPELLPDLTPMDRLSLRASDYFNALDKIMGECAKCNEAEEALAARIKAIAYEGMRRAWT
jgi:hypothetical protein